MSENYNVVFVLADQLRAISVPQYGLENIEMPGFNRMSNEGIVFTNAISTCPLCTPYRGMLLTGRFPQTTGLLFNYICTRYSEIGLGDAFKNAGYETGYVGKWHLHRGAFPSKDQCWIPKGRSRLGFDYWRAYNCHTVYFNGHVNKDDWDTEPWNGYETEGLLKYVYEFIDQNEGKPFFCFVSPHQPHQTHMTSAPDTYYRRLPTHLELPDNVPVTIKTEIQPEYHDYMAMVLAFDEMVQNVLDYLEKQHLLENTLVVVTSDHGTQMGAHVDRATEGGPAWAKRRPYEESIRVPLFIRLPNAKLSGTRNSSLVAPVDLFPTLCGLTGVPVPRSIEGHDLSDSVLGKEAAFEQQAVYLMNFSNFNTHPDWIREPGNEWRGVRTKCNTYVKWRNGNEELYDLTKDPLQLNNVIGLEQNKKIANKLRIILQNFMTCRKDDLHPYTYYSNWIDQERRIVRNANGLLSHPETEPDWSLL